MGYFNLYCQVSSWEPMCHKRETTTFLSLCTQSLNVCKRLDGRVCSWSNISICWVQIKGSGRAHISWVKSHVSHGNLFSLLTLHSFIHFNYSWAQRQQKSCVERTHKFGCKCGQNLDAKRPQNLCCERIEFTFLGSLKGKFELIQEGAK